MGLASSQARMLLLTARKSDLEYRAQMISQRKMNLAMQTQQLAQEYSRAMSNRKLEFVFNTSGNSNEVDKQNLTYNNLMALNSTANFFLKNVNGQYVWSGVEGEEKYNTDSKILLLSKLIEAGELKLPEGYSRQAVKDENEKIIGYEFKKGDTNVLDELWDKVTKGGTLGDKEYPSKPALVAADSINLTNANVLQDALRNGSLIIAQPNAETGDVENVSWSSISCIEDNLDTSDDAEAQAKYESESLILSNQDKLLDLELNQIQTQHKAIETEYDQVKKVIEKNIDVSFKIFS